MANYEIEIEGIYNSYKSLIDYVCNKLKDWNIEYITLRNIRLVDGEHLVCRVEYHLYDISIMDDLSEYMSGNAVFGIDIDLASKSTRDVIDELHAFFNYKLFYSHLIPGGIEVLRRMRYEE